MLHIAVEREGQPRKELRFAKDSIVIGREADHDLQLGFEDGASRQHCRIFAERGQIFVEDLGSRNGTKVGGKRIAAKTAITGRDEIEVGKVKIRLVDQAGTAKATVRPRAAEEPARAPAKPKAQPEPVKPEPAAREPARTAGKPAQPAAREPARPAGKPAKPEPAKGKTKPKPEPVAEADPPDSSIKVNLKPAEPAPAPAEPESKPSGPVNDENEACRSQIDPLARRWRDLGRPPGLLLHGPWLARGLAWVASDRKLRPRPSELHREFVYASRGDRRARIRHITAAVGALGFALTGGSVTARALHDDLALKDAAAGPHTGPSRCTPDNAVLQRADQLARRAAELTQNPELQILAGARAVAAAEGACARHSEAERVLRQALARQRSRVLGRGPSPIVAVDVGRTERDVVTVDESGAVMLWDRTGAGQGKPLSSPSGQARVAALGTEGRWLVVGTATGVVDLWDLGERAKPERIKQLESHRDPITAIAFSEDGRLFATGDRRGNIKIWDMRGTDAGAGLGELRAHTGPIEQLVFRDGITRLFSFGGKQAYAWDLQDGRRKGKPLLLAIGGGATAFAVNGEGDEVVVGDSIGQVLRWKVKLLARATSDALASHTGAVVDLAFVPKQRAVLSLGSDKQLIVTELDQMMRDGGEPLQVGLRGLQGEPLSLAADPTGRRIAVAARDGTAKTHKIFIWDIQQRKTNAAPVAEFDEHTDKIAAIRASFDGNSLLSASADGTLRLWPLQNADAGGALAILSDHRGAVTGLGLSSDGSRLLSFGQDRAVRAWRLDRNGAPRRILEQTLEIPIQTAALSPDGRWAAVAQDRQVLLYNLGAAAGDSKVKPIERSQHNDAVAHVAFNATSEWFVTADLAGTINTWRMRQEGPEDSPTSTSSLGRAVEALALSPTAPFYAAAGADFRVTLRPMTSAGGAAEQLVAAHEKNVLSLVFSGGGDYLVSTGEDYRAILRKVDKGRVEELRDRQAIAHDQRVGAAAFSPDKRWLATGSSDGVIQMTDLTRLADTSKKLVGHEGPIVALEFEPDSELLVSAGNDKTLRLWLVDDLDRGGEVRSIVLTGHGAPISALRLDGSGRLVATASTDGAIRVWPLKQELLIALACRTVGRDFTGEEWSALYSGDPVERLCDGK